MERKYSIKDFSISKRESFSFVLPIYMHHRALCTVLRPRYHCGSSGFIGMRSMSDVRDDTADNPAWPAAPAA
nr:hypothetical protein [uncultured Massilia sp.]